MFSALIFNLNLGEDYFNDGGIITKINTIEGVVYTK